MTPGRSPSRLRSKTSDISDLIRGNPKQHSTDALTPPVPPIPTTEATTPTKNRSRLAGLLGRKRKSGGFALDPASHSQKEDEEYPAIPDALLRSRIPAPSDSGSVSASLPSSLPPLNVSPPSLGGPFPSSSTSPLSDRFSTATNDSSQSGIKPPAPAEFEKTGGPPARSGSLRLLRPQKSTSFEVSGPFNFSHNATASNMAILNGGESKAKAKPVITVSAPPTNTVEEDAGAYNAPRAAPAPPPPAKSRHSRKTLNFGFGHHTKKDEVAKERRPSATLTNERVSIGSDAKSSKELPSPTASLSPMLPSKMEFPVPPSSSKSTRHLSTARASLQSIQTLPSSTGSSPATTPTARTPRAVVTSDTSDGELSHASTRSAPVRPTRPASLIIPNGGPSRPRSNSSQTVTKVPSTPSSPVTGRPVIPSRLRGYRASRSPSPASPPPITPLPSPPANATVPQASDVEGWSTDASTRRSGWSTDNSTRIGSLASRKSMMSGSRVRAHTIMGSISQTPAASLHSGLSSGGEDSDRARMRYARPVAGSSALASEKSRTAQKDTLSEKAVHMEACRDESSSTLTVSRPPSEGSRGSQESTTPTKDDAPTHSLRAAHDTYIRILQEKHAAEKAELVRRIERLEREARKRDKEIEGLRWIILENPRGGEHAAASAMSLDKYLAMGRIRSGSKSSEGSSLRSRTSSGLRSRADLSPAANLNSPEGSTEDGLTEIQSQVSDFIAPWQNHTPRMEPAQAERSGSPSSISSLRRSNTMPDAPAARHGKRSSSPVRLTLPKGSDGLGFDIPTIPSSESDASGGESSSVPSLTASNTASSTPSSTLSAIPEMVSLPSEDDQTWKQTEKEGHRASRALKRLSSSSLVQAASAYASNLKLGMSPSIEQVLDRTRSEQEAGMDEVLKKLRAFGGEH